MHSTCLPAITVFHIYPGVFPAACTQNHCSLNESTEVIQVFSSYCEGAQNRFLSHAVVTGYAGGQSEPEAKRECVCECMCVLAWDGARVKLQEMLSAVLY